MDKRLSIALCGVLLSACSTVTINPAGDERISSLPSYQERLTYYWWGLSGVHFINVDAICGADNTRQMQSQFTFEDGLLNLVTLGIYQPRTVKIWCTEVPE